MSNYGKNTTDRKVYKIEDVIAESFSGTKSGFETTILPSEDLIGRGDILVGTSQVEIDISGIPISIRIMADNSNIGTVYIGKTGVLSNGSNDFVRLESGDEVIMTYTDTENALYAISDNMSQTINVGALI